MKNIFIVIAIILTATAFIAGYILVQKALFNEAVDGCYQAGRLEFTNQDGNLANTPDSFWFEECMEKKGYEAN